MTDGFVIALSIAISIFVITSIVVLICRKKKNTQNTGQVIHYGGPQNPPPPPQYNASGWQPANVTISSQTAAPQYQTAGLPTYHTAIYSAPGSYYQGTAQTTPTNIIIRQVGTQQYYSEPYQANAVVVTSTENVQKY